MAKHLVDLDEDSLAAARAELGTTTIKDTVNEALRKAIRLRDRRVAAALDVLASAELEDRAGRVALSFLVDTSVVKRLDHAEVRSVVEPLASAGALGRPTICDLEVGYSARNAREWDRLVGALDAFNAVETTAAHLHRALQVQRSLAARSQRGRKIPDLVIAAAAEALGATVLHYDADFDLIASVTGQRCQWVVPAGSIP